MATIRKVRLDRDGAICRVKLGNGQELTIKQAVKRAERGRIEGVRAMHPQNRDAYVQSIPDDKKGNNLKNLPRF